MSDVVKDYSRTCSGELAENLLPKSWSASSTHYAAVPQQIFGARNGQARSAMQRSVDVRYRDQGYELNVPYTRNLIRDFRAEHQRRYGYNYPARELELVTLRLRATIKSQQSDYARQGERPGATWGRARPPSWPGKAQQGVPSPAPCISPEKDRRRNLFHRDSLLRSARRYSGPAVITEYSATYGDTTGREFPRGPSWRACSYAVEQINW